jgi:DNA-directed RNA polymerase specialized sigma24 family protein
MLRCEHRQPLLLRDECLTIRAADDSPFDLDPPHPAMDQLLDVLTEEERQLIQLFYLQDNSANEVGAATGQEAPSIYRRLHRIREKLRSIFQ